jgi:hypothetical protein
MVRPAATIVLTAIEQQKLIGWARAATTPQRLARRARIILGSAAGLGTRRLAQQERMATLAGSLRGGQLRRAAGSASPRPAERVGSDNACPGGGAGV